MNTTITCMSCSSKFCRKTKSGTFDICQYGISFVNDGKKIKVKEPAVPLSTIAKNLRHEINPILQTIIQHATKIDPLLSTKVIDTNNPLSIIVGSTIIIDNFIQMITGVHEFHSLPSSIGSKIINLSTLITSYYDIYGLIKEDKRTNNLKLENHIDSKLHISECSDFIKYITAVIIDNAWKYSIDNTTLEVKIFENSKGLYTIQFINNSLKIPDGFELFKMGTKVDNNSKGYGYGLNWIKTLESHYNDLLKTDEETRFKITHEQEFISEDLAVQTFSLINLKIII